METQMAGREPSATKGNQEQMGNNLEMGLKEQVTLWCEKKERKLEGEGRSKAQREKTERKEKKE